MRDATKMHADRATAVDAEPPALEIKALPAPPEDPEAAVLGMGTGRSHRVNKIPLGEIESSLSGLDAAAQHLGVDAIEAAQREIKAVKAASDLETPEAKARYHAVLGRLALRQGDYATAIASLRELHAAPLRPYFPRDVSAFELARAHLGYARDGRRLEALSANQADQSRRRAAELFLEVEGAADTRLKAAAEVERALALSEIEGHDEAQTRRVAAQAAAELKDVLRDYPNHPQVEQISYRYALALERSGDVEQGAKSLRELALLYAGSNTAKAAWEAYQRVAEEQRDIQIEPWSADESLLRAKKAREQRYVLWSRELLDAMDAKAKNKSDKQNISRQRAWTAYYQRDFDQCIQDVQRLPRGEQVSSYASLYGRCLERGGRYERAVDLAKSSASGSSRRRRKALWKALDLAVRGGLYDKANSLLREYARVKRRSNDEQTWMTGWLAYRAGKLSTAEKSLKKLQRRSGDEGQRARYFLAKISLERGGKSRRSKAYGLLRELIEEDPFSYYGLMARERLLREGQKVALPAALPPADPEVIPPYLQVKASLEQGATRYGQTLPAFTRLSQFYAAGYFEDARRELRFLSDQYLYTKAKLRRGRFLRPRDEGAIAGLSWKPKFSMPTPPMSEATRKLVADASAASDITSRLHLAAVALREHYRVARHADSSEREYLSRWLIRAYRAVVEREAERYEIPASRLWALMYTESRFRRHVVSYVGARGALQIMPWTGRQLEQRLGLYEEHFNPDTLYDIRYNLKLAAFYVSELMQKFQGQAPLAYASYNGGPSNVARWLSAKRDASAKKRPFELDDFIEEIPFGETYRYTRRVMQIEAAYRWMYERELPRWPLELPEQVGDNIDF